MTPSMRWLLETTAFMPFAGGLLRAIGKIVSGTGSGVTAINTTAPGITGGPITTTGNLAVQWNAGNVSTLGGGLTLAGGTLSNSAPFSDAPSDSHAYGRLNAAWAQVLPLTGGTMTGALNVTATGASAARSVQDHFGDVANVLDFGAKCDGTTDDTAAVNAALASANQMIIIPAGKCCFLPNGIIVPTGKTLMGLSFHADNPAGASPSPPSSSILTNANINSVTLGPGTSAVQGSSISDLVIYTNATVRPTAGAAVYVNAGYNVRLTRVMAYNCYDGFYWKTTGAAGISGYMENCASGRIAGHHLVQDTWPELRMNMCRFGMNGSGDYGALAHVLQTGGISGNVLPNTFYATACHFNEGPGGGAGSLLTIAGLVTGASLSPREFQFVNCHAEAITNCVTTDASCGQIWSLRFIGCFLASGTSGDFWNLNAATQIINQSQIIGCHIDVNNFTLGGASFRFESVSIIGNAIFSHATGTTLTSGNSASDLYFIGNSCAGTLALAGPWTSLNVMGTGYGTLNNTATGTVLVDNAQSGLTLSGGISVAGTVSGAGFVNWAAAPPAIGGTTAAAGSFTALSASGNATVAGPVLTLGSNAAVSPAFYVNGAAAQGRYLAIAQTAGLNRWGLLANSTAEGPVNSNNGSDLQITAFNDAGATLVNPMIITRSTGMVSINNGLTAIGPSPQITISAPAGTNRLIHLATAVAGVPKARWDVYADVSPEGGGNVGSAFGIARYDDSGNYIDAPITISRQTGVVTLAQGGNGLAIGTPTIRSGTGAASGTQPSGSIWIRTDGTAGNRMYVSQGGGTWVAIASV